MIRFYSWNTSICTASPTTGLPIRGRITPFPSGARALCGKGSDVSIITYGAPSFILRRSRGGTNCRA